MPVRIDLEKCVGCKICYELCPLDVFVWDKKHKKPTAAYQEECWHCGICWMECPKRAIDVTYPASVW